MSLQTAATLHDQTQQLNKVVDDLNEIEFTMKKASKIIADIGKGIMTDRYAANGILHVMQFSQLRVMCLLED